MLRAQLFFETELTRQEKQNASEHLLAHPLDCRFVVSPLYSVRVIKASIVQRRLARLMYVRRFVM